ncbi:MAG TPA: adenylate/guanylate cyclase domain-containing protein [Longimicrobiales bacterium]
MSRSDVFRRRAGAAFATLFRRRSIRTRLIVAFASLLAIGALNVLAFYRAATRREQVFAELRRAIERQTISLETLHQLESMHRQIKLLSGVIGVEGPPPSDAERERFAERVDAILARLARLHELSDSADRPAIGAIQRKAAALVASWKEFDDNRGVDPVRAIEAVVTRAEPLAVELINRDVPDAVEREKARLARVSEEFIQMDRASSRSLWIIFAASALVGSLLAVTTSRDLLRAIGALRLGAEKVGQGDLDHRIEIRPGDELAEVAASFNDMAARLRERTEEIDEQRRFSESLLLNILPRRVAEELRQKGRVDAKYLPDTTIMFADLVGFTRLFDLLSVDRMVRLLDELFTDFDRIVRGYGLEKLKTIGDAYMCAGGLLREGASHPVDTVLAAFDFIHAVERRAEAERLPLAIRIGIHTGPVAMGVVGIDKFAFDVWGETVNFAARLEAASEENRINLSNASYVRVKDFFAFEHRGEVETKDGKSRDMYFVRGVHPELVGNGAPPPAFRERYRAYFERPPANYPKSLVLV